MRSILFIRLAVVSAIAAALLVPLNLIQGKIAERRARADAVQTTFAAEMGGSQTIAGPFLALTCEESVGEPAAKRPCPTLLVAPASLDINGSLPVEQRYRGIYPIRLYRANLTFSGEFELPRPGSARAWKNAYLVLAISDPRGIKNVPSIEIAKQRRDFLPGPLDFGIKTGLHADLGSVDELRKAPAIFRFALELTGTTRLDVAPAGDLSRVRLASDWPHPSLAGAFPADEREISSAGFTAGWRVNQFATGGGAHWRDLASTGRLFTDARVLGVSLVEPVNPYSLSFRAVEYGFLFVLFTFSALALVEIVWGVNLHPVQYGFVGLALAVFFLILIALSEHIRFMYAYLSAAAACVLLLTYYLRHPLGSRARTGLFAAFFVALYCALYALLKSEDNALLLGSLLVFAALAAVMVATRRLDWSALSKRMSPA